MDEEVEGVRVEVVPLSSLRPDQLNANVGTEQGYYIVSESIEQRGLARGIFATRDGVIMAGSKTQQAALDCGLDKAILVHTTGDALVVTVRDDLQSADAAARRLALEDNRSSQVGLVWDPIVLVELAAIEGVVDGLFGPEDLSRVTLPTRPDRRPPQADRASVPRRCPKCGYEWTELAEGDER